MNSTITMYILLGFYGVITVQALWEKNWWRAAYFVGAIIISVSVLNMTPDVQGQLTMVEEPEASIVASRPVGKVAPCSPLTAPGRGG